LNAIVEGFKVVAARWELVLGIVALLGLSLAGSSPSRVVEGTIKVVIGVLILKVGSATLLGAFRPAMEILQKAFHITGIVMDPYGGWVSAMANLGPLVGTAAQIMVVGFLVNMLLARLTPLRYVYLTGHTMLAFSCFVAWLFKMYFGLTGIALLASGALVCGIYWTLLPAIVHRYSAPIAGDQFTLGHMSGVACVVASVVAPKLGKPSDSAENLKLPGFLSIFGNNVVATTAMMTIFFTGVGLLAGYDVVKDYAGKDNWILYSVFLGFNFAVGIVILLTGVRMMLAEVVPAFKGISDRLIPGAVPALDMPVFFPLAPTAAVLGFVGAFIGEFLGMGILLAFGSPYITIPGVIPTFFDGGTAGVFANHYGGWRASVIVGSLIGVVQMLGGALLYPLSGLKNAVYPNTDYTTVWVGISALMKYLSNYWVFMAVFVGVAGILFVLMSRTRSAQLKMESAAD